MLGMKKEVIGDPATFAVGRISQDIWKRCIALANQYYKYTIVYSVTVVYSVITSTPTTVTIISFLTTGSSHAPTTSTTMMSPRNEPGERATEASDFTDGGSTAAPDKPIEGKQDESSSSSLDDKGELPYSIMLSHYNVTGILFQ